MTELLMIAISLIVVGCLGWFQVRYSVPSSKERLFRCLRSSMGKRVVHQRRHCAGNTTYPTAGKRQLTR